MGLVDYSSEDSDAEDSPKVTAPASKATPSTSKPSFQKVVDRSAPNKIRVSLPSTAQSEGPSPDDASEPPAKRPRLGAGGGINSFLPAAKKPAAASAGQNGSGRGRGLGKGVNLRTGPEAAFSREPMPPPSRPAERDPEDQSNSESQNVQNSGTVNSELPPQPTESIEPKGKATMFRPLSVARKPAKKKTTVVPSDLTARDGSSTANPPGQASEPSLWASKPKPKVSLFSMDAESDVTTVSADRATEYQPLLYGAEDEAEPNVIISEQAVPATLVPSASAEDPNSLGAIADDLNLTASQRRQLFGRGGKNPAFGASASASAVNVVNFNTDVEYAANEERRAAGETPEQQHKAVRTVNTSGKNSLRSLINVVASNGDALEEHFAKGRRNKREAGSKYGW